MHWQFGEMEFGEMKHVELEQFLHAFTSRGFDSVSWAFLLQINRPNHQYQSIEGLDWIVQCFMSPPTQYRLYGRRFLQVKRPNQQYQNTEGESTKENNTKKHKENRKYTHKK